MSAPLDCPGTECWQALLHDALPPAERERCMRHLESCPACQDRVDRAEACEAALVQLARQVGDPTLAPADPTLVQVVGRLLEAKGPDGPAPAEPADLSFLRPAGRPGVLGMLGEYEVREVLGQGGMGLVLKAFDPALQRPVAIKVMAAAVAGSATARRRFTREARAAAAVCHEHVVAVHGVHEADGLPYLVMQYVSGESLQQRLDRAGPLEVKEVVRIGLQAASGLAAAHARGLIHRDVKPANLLLEDGLAKVKITDFGLARMADDVGLTRQGVLAGTPEYMAPEQARGEAVDHRADLFSLGSVLYACCTGQPPFRGAAPAAVLRQVSDGDPIPVRSLQPDVPAWLEALIARLLAKDPAGRFGSAAEVAALLEGYLAHLRQPATVPAPELPPPPSAGGPAEDGGEGMGQWGGPLALLWPLSPGAVASLLLLALGLCGLALGALIPPTENEHPRQHLVLDLNQGIDRLLPAELFGPDAASMVKTDAQGLRITVPAGGSDVNPVGVELPLRVHGDFEIALGYEILAVGDPPPDLGAGVILRVNFDSPAPHAAQLTRLRKPPATDRAPLFAPVASRGETFGAIRIIQGPDGKDQTDVQTFRAGEPAGKLKLVRTGSELQYRVTNGGSEYHQLRSKQVGTDDVQSLRLICFRGYHPGAVDVRLTDLVIDAEQLPAPAVAAAASPAAPRRSPYRGLALFGGLGLALAGLVLLYLLARKRRVRATVPVKPVQGQGAGPSAHRRPAPHGPPAGGGKGFRRPLWLALLAVPVALAVAAAVWFAGRGSGTEPAATAPQEYVHSFKGDTGPTPGFKPFGPLADRAVRFEPDGLRITLPPGSQGDGTGTGVVSTFGARGDFEATVGFEVLQETPPVDPERQTRFTLGVALDREGFNMATLSRRVRSKSETQYLAWVTLGDEAAGKNRQKAKGFPTKAMTGRLRLARTGPTLSYSAADGPDGPFVLLQQYPLGGEDLKDVRLLGATDDARGSLDVRVTDFQIRAAALPYLPAAAAPQAPPRGWWAGALLALAVVVPVALAAGVWLALRRGRRAVQPPARPAVPDRPPVAARCPGCGKDFKARAHLAGKKVKCPRCGTAVLVPANQPVAPGGLSPRGEELST